MAKGKTSTKGTTVLVDRLWPRGINKEDLRADEWLKDVAPTPQLRIRSILRFLIFGCQGWME